MYTMYDFVDVFFVDAFVRGCIPLRRGFEDAPGVEALKKSDFTIKYTKYVVICNLGEKTSSKGENN
jgi:hypothetical protein